MCHPGSSSLGGTSWTRRSSGTYRSLEGAGAPQKNSESFESRPATVREFRAKSGIDDPHYQKGTDQLNAAYKYRDYRIPYAACRIYCAYQAAWPYTTMGVRIQSPNPFPLPIQTECFGFLAVNGSSRYFLAC